jgi:hypothetical protein
MAYNRLLASEILSHWPQLEPCDVETIQPDIQHLAALLETRYGFCRDRARREVELFFTEFAERLHRAVAA